MTKPNVTFFGLGTMGGGMARRILGAGYPLTVHNRSPEKCAPFVADGARVARTPREATVDADFIVSMVADDAASRGVWLGEKGALAGAKNGATLVESSTLSADWIAELAALAHARGCDLLDAPVTGSKPQAAAGELSFLVGGSEEALGKARPMLGVMSKAIVHLGPTGSGAQLKLINNFVCGVQAASLAEAVELIERSGLDREKSLAILTGGAPGGPLVRTLAERMTSQSFAPNFLLRLMAKDLDYAITMADARSLDLVSARAALQTFRRAVAEGHGEKDIAAVVTILRESNETARG